MRLALDAMGGDDAPRAMVQGALDYALAHPAHTVILVGREADVKAALAAETASPPANLTLRHASQVIGMADKISALKEQPDDSMNVCARLVKQGEADGMVLCGNTGCSVGAAQLHLGRIRGVKRAAILTPLPTATTPAWLLDSGANAVGKPEHLAQWGELASVFVRHFVGISQPSVGVLSIGEEDEKGDDLVQETLALLRQSPGVRLHGNVEGKDIFKRTTDIVVCDGFTGNVVLKAAEGLMSTMMKLIRDEITASFITKLGGLLVKPAFRRIHERTHWSKVGGCLLLGTDGVCVIGHGRSNRVAVFHALRQAATCVEREVIRHLRSHLAQQPASGPFKARRKSPYHTPVGLVLDSFVVPYMLCRHGTVPDQPVSRRRSSHP